MSDRVQAVVNVEARATVAFHQSPWVTGTRASGTYGPVCVERASQPLTFESDLEAVLNALSMRACSLGANAIVGLTIDVHLQEAGGYRLFACGTAARLEALH